MLRKLKGLYSSNTYDFNINWLISDLTETNYSLELIKETPARTWKYFTLAKFLAKGTSYYPVERDVKVNKSPGFEMEHLSLTKLSLKKLFKAGSLYSRESKHYVSFRGRFFQWKQQFLVSKQHVTR